MYTYMHQNAPLIKMCTERNSTLCDHRVTAWYKR